MSSGGALVYLGDRFVDASEARVSLFDRGFLFGDSIFETLRTYGGRAFAFDRHYARLARASDITGIAIPESAALAAIVDEGVERAGHATTYVRITVSRGEGGSGLGTAGCDRPWSSIIFRAFDGYPAHAYAEGIDSKVLATRRVPAACLDPAMKTGNYLPSVLGKRELERDGMIEGVQLSTDGDVVSGTVSNVFFVRGADLLTPSVGVGCRPGVTREILLELAPRAGLAAKEVAAPWDAFGDADEMFFANTLMECLPVRGVGGRTFTSAAAGSRTRRLLEAYREVASSVA